jgi:hypothetical protein
VRLLIIGSHTRNVPEITIGRGLVVGAVLGDVSETIVRSADLSSPEKATSVLAVTQVAWRGAPIEILVFTIAIFRPSEIWAKALGFWCDVFAVFRTLAAAWGATESFVFSDRSKLQVELGLTSHVRADRFLCRGLGSPPRRRCSARRSGPRCSASTRRRRADSCSSLSSAR